MWTDKESEEGEETDSNLPGLKMIPFMLSSSPYTPSFLCAEDHTHTHTHLGDLSPHK